MAGCPPGMPGGSRDRVGDHGDQARRAGERLARAGGDDAVGDAVGEPLLAVDPQHSCEIGGRPGVDDRGRGEVGIGVHPHVQRCVDRVGEAALRGGRSAGTRGRGRGRWPGPAGRRPRPAPPAVRGRSPGTVRTRSPNRASRSPATVEGGRVAVDADQAGLRGRRQDQGGVAAQPEGAVDVDRSGRAQRRGEQVDDPVGHHRHVGGVGARRPLRPCSTLSASVPDSCDLVPIRVSLGSWHRGRCARDRRRGLKPHRTSRCRAMVTPPQVLLRPRPRRPLPALPSTPPRSPRPTPRGG